MVWVAIGCAVMFTTLVLIVAIVALDGAKTADERIDRLEYRLKQNQVL